jgi:NitT/TauT family transport system ATP-binding protein
MSDILKFIDIDMSYYDLKKETEVLKNISFDFKDKNITAIIGPSGCGKSTILNLISGLIKPTKGTLIKPESVGYMFQKDNLFEWLTILNNVLIGLKIQKKLTVENIEYAKNLLIKYGLKDFIDSYPNELSGGMRQRVSLIRALVTKPKLLLLDEPFSALDAQTRIKVSSDIYKIIKELEIETVLVTHDVTEAITLSDEIIILSDRPSTIIKTIEIEFNNLTPEERRKSSMLSKYFNEVWSEINDKASSRLY